MTEQTRRQLMETGRRLFAGLGLEGARVDEIARESGVNKALINYHFRGKKGLYEAVLADLSEKVGAELETELRKLESPARRLAAWPEILWSVLERHPDFAPLFVRELVGGCESLAVGGLDSAGRGLSLMASTLDEGDRRREIDAAEPFPLHLLVLGTLLVARISDPLRQRLEGILPPEQVARSGAAMVPLLKNLIGRGLLDETA